MVIKGRTGFVFDDSVVLSSFAIANGPASQNTNTNTNTSSSSSSSSSSHISTSTARGV